MTDARALVKRMAMTGALTYGSVHLESPNTWGPNNLWVVPEDVVEGWLNDPEPNAARDRAYTLALNLLGER
jgi:hypothetical protein